MLPSCDRNPLRQQGSMDPLSLHLMVNHVPVIAVILGTVLVLLALAARRRWLWQLGTASIAVAALSFYPVTWTGGNAEHEDMKDRKSVV